jgi:hypothetical protein
MFGLAYNVLMMLKVLFIFFIFFIFLPSRVIRFQEENQGFLDKFFISFTHATVVTIIIVHFLVFIKLYELISLLVCYIIVYIFLIWIRGRSWRTVAESLGMNFIIHLLELSEGRTGFIFESLTRLRSWLKEKRNNTIQVLKKGIHNPFLGLFPCVVFTGAFYLRFRHAIFHDNYTASDPYLHLAWLKQLDYNLIYPQGIYPFGYHAFLSALANLSNIDPYWLCRFMGPLGGTLTVLAVYYFAVRMTKNYSASLVSLAVYGLVTTPLFAVTFLRHTAALPQEFSAIFVLPGIYFLWLFFQTGKRPYLLLFSEIWFITIMIHPYAAFFLGICVFVLTILILLAQKTTLRVIWQIVGYGFIATIFALLPLGIGKIMGLDFFKSSVDYIQQAIEFRSVHSSILHVLYRLVLGNPFLIITFLFFIIMGVGLISRKHEDRGILYGTVGLCTLTMFFMFLAPELNLPAVTDPARTGVFLAPFIAILYAGGLDSMERIFPVLKKRKNFKRALFSGIAVTICVLIIWKFPPKMPNFDRMEYEAAVNNYLNIKKNFPPMDWTIVAPTEQYQQALGIGWHYEILQFVQKYTPGEAGQPEFQFPIPTHHIFVYTEKIPLHLERSVTTEDAKRELDPKGKDDPFAKYYHTGDQRGIIEAKAIRLMEAYSKTHQNVSVFYEDKQMKIYHIYHQPPEDSGTGGE